MKKISRMVLVLFIAAASSSGVLGQEKQPAYIYLFSRFSDFVNVDMTENRIREAVTLLDKYSREHPQAKVSATFLFSGALSEALAERNAKTGIEDYLLDAARRGLVEFGYDGTDEPTYSYRPIANLANIESPEERWHVGADSAEKFLTEARDPVSGQVLQGKPGGLKAMQEIFGEAVCVRGLNVGIGGDTEYVHQLLRYNTKAILWGLPDPNPALNIHGYRGSIEQFGKAMSPIANSSPELNWMDDVLRLSESSDAAIRVVSAHEGPEAIQKVLSAADRSHIRIVHVELDDVRMYLSQFYDKGELYPPLKIAYDHPDRPKLPAEAFADSKKLEANRANQESMMKWLVTSFLPANSGSRFITSTDIPKMFPSTLGQSISVAELEKSATGLLKAWANDTYLPDYVTVGDRYLSLAETFQTLCDVFAEERRSGKRPAAVRIRAVYGPLQMLQDHGPALGETTGAAVEQTASALAVRFREQAWKPLPDNTVPMTIDIGTLHLTGGQFLRLMLETLVAPSLSAQLKVKMTYNLSSAALEYPKQRLPRDQGGTWTFKPAPFESASTAQTSAKN